MLKNIFNLSLCKASNKIQKETSRQAPNCQFPLMGGGGGLGGSPPPLTKKLACPPYVLPPTVLTQKCQFCNFQAVFGHLPKLSPHQSTPFGKPWLV